MSSGFVLPEVTSVQFALELTQQSEVFATYFNRKEVLEDLREAVSETALSVPVSTESFERFRQSYMTEEVIQKEDWLQLIFRYSRFDLLQKICKKNPESCRDVLPHIDSLPLSTFQAIWLAIGDENDLLRVLESRLLQTFEKEDRVVFALKQRPIRKRTAYTLCLAAVVTSPLVFTELAKQWPDAAQRVVTDGITFDLEVTPEELVNFERSLLLTQGEISGAKQFGREFLKYCLEAPFQYERTMVAWGFFRRRYDRVADKAYLTSLLRLLRKDNRLWFVNNLLHFVNERQ